MTVPVYLQTGSNLGNRAFYLDRAREQISDQVGLIRTISAIYESAAWGNTHQQDFLNQVLVVETSLDPLAVLNRVLNIENLNGRERTEKWGPRTLDIDILFYGQAIIKLPELMIPHPRMGERNFVLYPLKEIAGNFIHPELGISVDELLKNSPDKSSVSKWKRRR